MGPICASPAAGEPMLHPQAVELFTYAKRVGCKIGLITNGSAFTERNSLPLLESGLDMIEFSVDARDPETYAIVRKGLKWERLLQNARRMIDMRNSLGSASKIVASGVNQKGVDIDAVEQFWRDEIGVDNFIKRKFLTWGVNTDLDASRSADRRLISTRRTCPVPSSSSGSISIAAAM